MPKYVGPASCQLSLSTANPSSRIDASYTFGATIVTDTRSGNGSKTSYRMSFTSSHPYALSRAATYSASSLLRAEPAGCGRSVR